jgi:transposase
MGRCKTHLPQASKPSQKVLKHALVFLPPYAPDLSPIELCWSKLKQLLRSAKARTREALDQALTQIVNDCISAEDALGWFAHCGLFI